ncbi:MAG: hypothetical protein K6G43_00160 [Lachnospiraceae bacterium]|nr:hypothetical protein [Lachnospiraceae bacterium]
MPEEKIISKMPAEAFLIKDDSLKCMNAPFFDWLHENGFKHAWHKGHYGMNWVFVNITHKLYAYGMPGVEIVKPVGNHAITIDEFMTIYGIYEKYNGLKTLE